MVDNFEGEDSGENEIFEPEGELAVNLSELNLVDHNSKGEWYVDSGASKHVTGSKSLLRNLEMGSSFRISTAGGEKLNVAGKGVAEISTCLGEIKFDNVLYVPGVTKNLLSVGTITDGNTRLKLLFDSGKVWILRNFPSPDPQYVVTTRIRDTKNGLYKFRPPNESINSLTDEQGDQLFQTWHKRLGHAS